MFVIHHIIGSRFVRRVSNGIFVFLLFISVQICLMLLMADSTLDLLVGLGFFRYPWRVCSFCKIFLFHTYICLATPAFVLEDFPAAFPPRHHPLVCSLVCSLVLCPGELLQCPAEGQSAWDEWCTRGTGAIRWQKGLRSASCSGLLLTLASGLQRISGWLGVMTRRSELCQVLYRKRTRMLTSSNHVLPKGTVENPWQTGKLFGLKFKTW